MVYFNNQKQNDSLQSHVLSRELRHEHKENVPELTCFDLQQEETKHSIK